MAAYPLYGAQQKRQLPSPTATKKVGATDPYGAMSDIARLQQGYLNLAAAGPDYSSIDYDKLNQIAIDSVKSRLQPIDDRLQRERDFQKGRQGMSQEAAKNFAAAMAGILQGGKTGDEGMAYAKENYGGSYLGAMAASMGQTLLMQTNNYFNEQDRELMNKIADLWDQLPGEAEKVYADLVDMGMERVQESHKAMLAAGASAIKFERDNIAEARADRKERRDAFTQGVKALTGGTLKAKAPYPIQGPNGRLDLFDPNTGTITVLRPPTASGSTAKPPSKVKVNGQWLGWNPKTGTYDTPIAPKDASTGTQKAPATLKAKAAALLKANIAEIAQPLPLKEEDRLAAIQAANSSALKQKLLTTGTLYKADPKFFKNGRWTVVLPGGVTTDPKKAARVNDYGTIVASAMDMVDDLYDLGWTESRVRSWVVGQLRSLGIRG